MVTKYSEWWNKWWNEGKPDVDMTLGSLGSTKRIQNILDWMQRGGDTSAEGIQRVSAPEYDWGGDWEDEWKTYTGENPYIFRWGGKYTQQEKDVFRTAFESWQTFMQDAAAGEEPGGNPNDPYDPNNIDFGGLEKDIREKLQPYIDDLGELYDPENLPEMYDTDQGALERLMNELENQPGWGKKAERSEARQLGFLKEDGTVDLGALRAWKQKAQGGVNAFEGLTPEQEAAMRKAQGLGEQDAALRARKMAETAFGNSGGMLAKMQEAFDEGNRSIANDRARFELDLVNQDFAQKLEEQKAYDAMFQRGQLAYKEYLDRKQEATVEALQGWYLSAQALSQQYNDAWTGITETAGIIQSTAALAMGADAQILQNLLSAFNLSMLPEMTQKTFEQLDATIDQIERDIADGNFDNLITLISTVGDMIGAIGELIPG